MNSGSCSNLLESIRTGTDNVFLNKCIYNDEILDEESIWSVGGFIASRQREHHVRGTGIIVSPAMDAEWDYHLAAIVIA